MTATRKNWRRVYDALTVGRSRFAGRGLFAGTHIPARAKIGEYQVYACRAIGAGEELTCDYGES